MNGYKESFNSICEKHNCATCPLENDPCDDYTCRSESFYKAGYEQGRADMLNEIKMLFRLAISEKPSRTINECEAEIILRNVD